MYPKPHIILGFVFSTALYLIFPQISLLEASIVFLASVLIDVDHYLYYVFTRKDPSLPRAYDWFVKLSGKYQKLSIAKRKKVYLPICTLHYVESFIFIYLMALVYSPIYFILLGFGFHRLFDDLYSFVKGNVPHDISLVYKIINPRHLKKIEEISS